MTITLHRFALSPFSEKARACLDFKGLTYTVVDHTPGPGQLAVYRRSGQRKVPVLEHDGAVVHDSTAIALYLEHAFPLGRGGARALLPDDFTHRRAVLDLEDRLDDVLGRYVGTLFAEQCLRDREWLDAVGAALGASGRAARVGLHTVGAFAHVGSFLPPGRALLAEAHRAVRALLHALCERIARDGYLCGPAPTLADVAAVGLTLPMAFPDSAWLGAPALRGRSLAQYAHDPVLGRFFQWKAQFYKDFLR